MNTKKIYTAIGLMSGTSMDGIDAALIKTDGQSVIEFGASLTVPYDDAFKISLRSILGPVGRAAPGVTDVERRLTILHADAVKSLLARAGLEAADVDVVGFHGHTIHHDPGNAMTVQLGEGALLADWLGLLVVSDFRSQDVAAGGEGAPLVPVFHAALVRSNTEVKLPAAVLNIGGVANVTWVGQGEDGIVAFDTGPGNAPLDDWVSELSDQSMDRGGALAAEGRIDEDRLANLLGHEYFTRVPPKSLDRQDFTKDDCTGLSLKDGAATLTAFMAQAAAKARDFFPHPVHTWVVTGGGRLNPVVMAALRDILGVEVRSAEGLGWDGDALEAQAFAYLAVRSECGLPLSFPTTTGAPNPMRGGVRHEPT